MPTLNWLGKDKIVNHHKDVPFHVLEKKYTFTNEQTEVSNNETEREENKIIHGDNLLALKSLLLEYESRIKCIYIDPPYNTGNEKWVYNDNVNDPRIKKWLSKVVGKQGEDLSRDDKWLCMMYPRLKLLQQLLSNNGVIFISIDDNEQANLKLLCDEIFGKNNLVANIPWQSRASIQNDTDFSLNHEYILCYAKKRRQINRRLKESNKVEWYNNDGFVCKPLPLDKSKYSNPDNDDRGLWKADPFDAPNIRPNLTYPIINPNTGERHLPPHGRCWRTEYSNFVNALSDNRILFGADGKGRPQLKVFYNEKKDFGAIDNSWFSADRIGTTTMGTKELITIFGKKIFDTPKPISMLQKILYLANLDKDSIILDSFAGSGTTAHAVMKLNKEDNGNRKFILIEMMDYAETITAERVKRVIKGYKDNEPINEKFTYYELGKPLFNEEGNLNEEVGEEKIREYTYYTETKQRLNKTNNTEKKSYLLDNYNNTGYYFYYKKEEITVLDRDTLASIIESKQEQYIIYADVCHLSEYIRKKYNIIFKKIPRDIRKF